MKTLTQHIEERLIINKNYKNIDDIEKLFDDIDFKRFNRYELGTSDDIFSIMVNYIRNYNIRSFSDFDSYMNTSQEDCRSCLAVFNKHIKEIDIFQKTANDRYKVFIIFKLSYADSYMFEEVERSLTSMHCLNKSDIWNNADEVEYYEILEKTFDDISELFNKLIKK